MAEIAKLYPDVRIEVHATAGRRLSDELQDGSSFRYGIVNLGGASRDDLLERFEHCRAKLGFVLLPIGARTSEGESNAERSDPCENEL
jgi:hypothetical protein